MHMDEDEIRTTIQLIEEGSAVTKEDAYAFFQTVKAKGGIINLVEYLRKFKFERLLTRSLNEALLTGPVPYFPYTDMPPLEEYPASVSSRPILGIDAVGMPGFTKFPYRRGPEILGHVSQILRVSFDKSDRYFFTGSDDGMLKLWDTRTGLLIHSFIGHKFCINDICTSSDNQILCSVDALGQLNVWCLDDFSLCFSMNVGQEVDFIEFVRLVGKHCDEPEKRRDRYGEKRKKSDQKRAAHQKENEKETEDPSGQSQDLLSTSQMCALQSVYQVVLVERLGVIRVITFTLENIISNHENSTINDFAGDNPIQAVCITEGGRFLLCGGLYPFLILFDLYHVKDNLLVLETEGYSITFVVASRASLKFAASTSFEIVLLWEFLPDATFKGGNFKRKSKLEGCWKKTTIDLKLGEKRTDPGLEELNCVQMCFLADDRYLVCVCSDSKIRIYFNSTLFKVVDHSIGALTPHPLENTFVICNEKMEILSFDHVLVSETLVFDVVDCQFSVDGEYLILCDEIGKIRIYAVNTLGYRSTPTEQFFISDFQHLDNVYFANYYVECVNDKTFDYAKNQNEGWALQPFKNEKRSRDARSMKLERMGFELLKDDFLTIKSFKNKYFVIDEKGHTDSFSVSTLHSNEILSSEGYFSEVTSEPESDKEDVKRIRKTSVRSLLDHSEIDAVSGCSLGSEFTLSDMISDTTSEENIQRRDQKRRSKSRSSSRKKAFQSTKSESKKKASPRKASRTSETYVEPVDDALRDYVKTWMLSTENLKYFPQINDEIRFLARRYQAFLEVEHRPEFKCNYPPEDCNLLVAGMGFIRYDPCYVVLELKSKEMNALYQIKYYEIKGLGPIFVLLKNYTALVNTRFKLGSTYLCLFNDRLVTGRCCGVSKDQIEMAEIESVKKDPYSDLEMEMNGMGTMEVEKVDLYLESRFEMPKKEELIEILEQNKRNKMVYTSIRRHSNLEYDENVAYPLNFSTILQRIRNDFYRCQEALKYDLETVRENSKFLPRGYEECVRGILYNLYALLETEYVYRHSRRRRRMFSDSY